MDWFWFPLDSFPKSKVDGHLEMNSIIHLAGSLRTSRRHCNQAFRAAALLTLRFEKDQIGFPTFFILRNGSGVFWDYSVFQPSFDAAASGEYVCYVIGQCGSDRGQSLGWCPFGWLQTSLQGLILSHFSQTVYMSFILFRTVQISCTVIGVGGCAGSCTLPFLQLSLSSGEDSWRLVMSLSSGLVYQKIIHNGHIAFLVCVC